MAKALWTCSKNLMRKLLSLHLLGLLQSVVLALSLWLLGVAGGWAQTELIERVEVLEDPTAALTIETIDMQAFTPGKPVFAAGFTTSAYWLRVHVRMVPGRTHVNLLVLPTTLDHISLFVPEPDASGRWRETRIGGRHPIKDEHWSSSLRSFGITPTTDGGVYLLRVETAGTLSVKLSALTEAEAHRLGLQLDMRQIAYLAMLFVLMVWSLRTALLTQEPMFWWFGVLQAVWMLHNTFFFGYVTLLFQNVYAGWIFLSYRALVLVVTALSLLFHRSVLARFAPPRAALSLFDLMLAVVGVAFVLYLAGYWKQALMVNSCCIVAAPIAMLINASTARTQASPGLATMRVIYGALSSFILLWSVTLLGLTDEGIVPTTGIIVHGTATGLLMFIILHLHSRNLFRDARQATADLVVLEARREFEHDQNQMLARFIDMLTHETKNAMAVINMSASSPSFGARQRDRIEHAIRDLTMVIDRCNQAVRLDTQGQAIVQQSCDAAAILRDVCQGVPDAERVAVTAPPQMMVESDPVLMRVMFANLIENALKYSPPASVIWVTMQTDQAQQVAVWIENEAGASGLPDPSQVFQKYYRSHRALAQIGSGLGLYMVQNLARLLGGGITYEPEGSRARFRLWLPC
jgi:two-component system, sensor histidine kinase LadS